MDIPTYAQKLPAWYTTQIDNFGSVFHMFFDGVFQNQCSFSFIIYEILQKHWNQSKNHTKKHKEQNKKQKTQKKQKHKREISLSHEASAPFCNGPLRSWMLKWWFRLAFGDFLLKMWTSRATSEQMHLWSHNVAVVLWVPDPNVICNATVSIPDNLKQNQITL